MLAPGGVLIYSALGPESFTEWRAVLAGLGLPSGLTELPRLPGTIHEERLTPDASALAFLKRIKAVGGLTLGADPVATAILHAGAARGRGVDAFVVRKQGKAHGLQRRIEGPDVTGRRVLAVEDTSTTGGSVLDAVEALRAEDADIVGVAVVVDRGAGAAVRAAGLEYRAAYSLADLGLS